MTTEEAIRRLDFAIEFIPDGMWVEIYKMAIGALRNYADCRNELCLKCGRYKESHLGACKDCRWETLDD